LSAAGYSGTPLIRKLGMKPGHRVLVIDAPDDYWELLGELPPDVEIRGQRTRARVDFVHIFADSQRGLRRLRSLKRRIAPDGMIWVSWPKRSSGVATDLDGNVVRGAGLAVGLVDIKVCAVDDTWSGLKFVIPVEDR